jgi:leucyl/phenylalanyl-tRNA--protein transferase
VSGRIPPLDPDLLLRAYTVGVFPMADSRDAPSVYWVEPKTRAILPLDGFHLSKSLKKTLLSGRYETTANRDFAGVVRLCAEAVANRPDTWINSQIENAVRVLHGHGHPLSQNLSHTSSLLKE